MTLPRNCGVIYLLDVVIIVNGAEVESTILLTDKRSLSFSNCIHMWNCPQSDISPMGLINMLHVDVGRETINVMCIVTLKIKDAIHH
jgi:hypothetical protein